MIKSYKKIQVDDVMRTVRDIFGATKMLHVGGWQISNHELRILACCDDDFDVSFLDKLEIATDTSIEHEVKSAIIDEHYEDNRLDRVVIRLATPVGKYIFDFVDN